MVFGKQKEHLHSICALLHRWKVDESCMLAVGSIQPLISDKVSKGELQFDIPRFLTEVVLPALDTSGNCMPHSVLPIEILELECVLLSFLS